MNWRGYAYFRLGNFTKAERDFDGAARMYPNEPVYLYERGVAKMRMGDRAGGQNDVAAAKKMSAAVVKKMAEMNIAP